MERPVAVEMKECDQSSLHDQSDDESAPAYEDPCSETFLPVEDDDPVSHDMAIDISVVNDSHALEEEENQVPEVDDALSVSTTHGALENKENQKVEETVADIPMAPIETNEESKQQVDAEECPTKADEVANSQTGDCMPPIQQNDPNALVVVGNTEMTTGTQETKASIPPVHLNYEFGDTSCGLYMRETDSAKNKPTSSAVVLL